MNWLSELFSSVFLLFDKAPFIRALFGVILVFILPGFAWSFVFLKQVKIFERIVYSVPLSLVIVTLRLIVANRFAGMKITGLSSSLVILGIIIIAACVWYLNKVIGNKTENTSGEG